MKNIISVFLLSCQEIGLFRKRQSRHIYKFVLRATERTQHNFSKKCDIMERLLLQQREIRSWKNKLLSRDKIKTKEQIFF